MLQRVQHFDHVSVSIQLLHRRLSNKIIAIIIKQCYKKSQLKQI